jgi:hypothetical protein
VRLIVILWSVGLILLAAATAFADPVTIVTDQDGRAYAVNSWTVRDVMADAISRGDKYYHAARPAAYMSEDAIEELKPHARAVIDRNFPDLGEFLQDYLSELSAREFAKEVAIDIDIAAGKRGANAHAIHGE